MVVLRWQTSVTRHSRLGRSLCCQYLKRYIVDCVVFPLTPSKKLLVLLHSTTQSTIYVALTNIIIFMSSLNLHFQFTLFLLLQFQSVKQHVKGTTTEIVSWGTVFPLFWLFKFSSPCEMWVLPSCCFLGFLRNRISFCLQMFSPVQWDSPIGVELSRQGWGRCPAGCFIFGWFL